MAFVSNSVANIFCLVEINKIHKLLLLVTQIKIHTIFSASDIMLENFYRFSNINVKHRSLISVGEYAIN